MVGEELGRGRAARRGDRRATERLTPLERHEALRHYIDVEIVRLEPRRKDSEGKRAAVERFNAALGDPQRSQPAVQVAGTAGKGSVCTALSHALRAAGLRVGLHTSPYLQAFSEKTWIDGRYASPEALWEALEVVRPVAERFRRDDECPASVHGMTSLAVSNVAFARAQLDVVVMETGCGGRYDLVQGLDHALCLITDLALDHVHALGPGLREIAWHKAGILRAGVPAAALTGPAVDVLVNEAERVGASLQVVDPDRVFVSERALDLEHLGRVELSEAPRGFRRRNLALAACGLDALAAAGWSVSAETVRAAAEAPAPPARMERVAPNLVLDCAHNSHELLAALDACPRPPRTLLVAFSGQRDPAEVLACLRGRGARVLATELDLYGKRSVPAAEVAERARSLGLEAEAHALPEAALDHALATSTKDEEILVTGSMFLVGRLRGRFYSADDVILQGTSWPTPSP